MLGERTKHIQRVHAFLFKRCGDVLVEGADLRPGRGAAEFVLDGLDQEAVIVLSARCLLQPFDTIVHLIDQIVDLVWSHLRVWADGHVSAEKRNPTFQVTYHLVPLGVAAANVVLPDEIGFGEGSAERILIKDDRAPVIAHVGTQIPRVARFLGGLEASERELLIEGDTCRIRLAGQAPDILAQT